MARLNIQENTIYTLEQEKEHYKHELEKMKKVNQNQGIELGHKSKEISNYITNEEKHNEKIRELYNKIQGMTEIEMEYKRDQEEYIMQIADLEAAISSQSHTEQVLHNDLQDARREIARLMTEANHTSIESQQEGSAASEESNILDSNKDEKAEDTSLVWDNSAGNLLLGQLGEVSHSTPKPKDPLCTNEEEDNKKIYENTAQISKENSRNELLEDMTSADEANQARMQMILRNKEELQEPKRFKDFF